MLFPEFAFSRGQQDTLAIERTFSYKRNFTSSANGNTANAYIKYDFRTTKRNPTLLLIPTMYYIARGRRNYVGEVYGKITYNNSGDYGMKRQVALSTIPHNSKTMPTVIQYISPNLYDASMYKDIILSPFHRSNAPFYRYRISQTSGNRSYMAFTPRKKNTQLVYGYAIIDNATGRIVSCRFQGENDMVGFDVDVDMGETPICDGLLPASSSVAAQFKFAGNKIKANVIAVYDCPTTLPDSISNANSPELMDSVRPRPLSAIEKDAYRQYAEEQTADTDTATTEAATGISKVGQKAFDLFGDYLLNSTGVETSNMSISVSPILNPLYLSYSKSRGIAYKLKIGARYMFSTDRYLSLTPDLGYNFKIKQFFFNSSLRYTYNSGKDRWIELQWANGNRITNSNMLDMIKTEHIDTINFAALNLDYFKDGMLKGAWNTTLGKWLTLKMGAVYHRRKAVNPPPKQLQDKPSAYYSFAPFATVTYTPYPQGPVFTGNYERGLRHIMKSNTEYERWEFDMSFGKRLQCMRRYLLRVGGGFYTNKESVFFVDFDNFHEDYLPGGWNDDWAGDFQLLNSQWYNASRYYLRTNASYESPLLLLSWVPLLGRYVETERIYLNTLQIQHTRPYFEVGYGFSTRYFSFGLFGSFLNGSQHEIGGKFTLELFRKW